MPLNGRGEDLGDLLVKIVEERHFGTMLKGFALELRFSDWRVFSLHSFLKVFFLLLLYSSSGSQTFSNTLDIIIIF